MDVTAWSAALVDIVWGLPMVLWILAAGIFFTLYLGLIQIRALPHALALLTGKYKDSDIKTNLSRGKALAAALSGTVGLGNIAGVSVAIAMGGPGAIFWMWIVAIGGMALRFTECSLASIYREKEAVKGNTHGGPMWYMLGGIPKGGKILAWSYAFCLIPFAIGVGCLFQTNQAASAIQESFGIDVWITGLFLCVSVAVVIVGGVKRIGQVAEMIVPLMCGIYLLGVMYICVMNWDKIPFALSVILNDAFTGDAAAGGVVGTVIITGVRRALFSTGAGLGDAAMMYAAVETRHPMRQGVVASLGPMIDTIIICTATAIVVILSGLYGTERYQELAVAQFPVTATQQQYQMGPGWQFSQHQVPKNTNKLQQFRRSADVIRYDNATAGAVMTTPEIPLVAKGGIIADGIRFSAYQKMGHMKLDLINDQKVVLASFKLGDPEAQTSNDFTINASHEGWYSHVIRFDDDFKSTIKSMKKENQDLRLQFTSLKEDSEWYIDKIASIREVVGVELSVMAFDKHLPGFGSLFVTFAIILLAFSTMITFAYYTEIGADYIFGFRYGWLSRFVFLGAAFVGSILELTLVINLSDVAMAGMAVVNITALYLLAKNVKQEMKAYFQRLRAGEFS